MTSGSRDRQRSPVPLLATSPRARSSRSRRRLRRQLARCLLAGAVSVRGDAAGGAGSNDTRPRRSRDSRRGRGSRTERQQFPHRPASRRGCRATSSTCLRLNSDWPARMFWPVGQFVKSSTANRPRARFGRLRARRRRLHHRVVHRERRGGRANQAITSWLRDGVQWRWRPPYREPGAVGDDLRRRPPGAWGAPARRCGRRRAPRRG